MMERVHADHAVEGPVGKRQRPGGRLNEQRVRHQVSATEYDIRYGTPMRVGGGRVSVLGTVGNEVLEKWYRYGDSNPGPVAENHVS